MATLKDIATACGVSTASVSKALHHAPDISADTAERIRRTAKELGYHPNAAARALKTNRTYNIGFLFKDESNMGFAHEYFSEVLAAAKEEAESHGYDVSFISRNIGPSKTGFLEHCNYRGYDGVLIVCIDFQNPEVAELIASDIPVVTIDHVFDNRSSVISDNVQGMRKLVEYIYSMGHRRIAYIHGEDTLVTRSRLASFHKTCKELGLQIPDEWVCEALYHDPKSSGLQTRKLLSLENSPTCILYPDDISLLGGATELENQGLRIPEDISVAGYDGALMSRVLRPVMTTMRQDSKTLGQKAASLLIEAIEEPKTYIPRMVMVPGELQTGGSVARI